MKKFFHFSAVVVLASFLSFAWLGSTHHHTTVQSDCAVCHVIHETPVAGESTPAVIATQTLTSLSHTPEVLLPYAPVVRTTGRSPPAL